MIKNFVIKNQEPVMELIRVPDFKLPALALESIDFFLSQFAALFEGVDINGNSGFLSGKHISISRVTLST